MAQQPDLDAKADRPHAIRSVQDTGADTRRGGEVYTLLSPKSADSTSGFMGFASIAPGDRISEHYHPYSEEFVYCVSGTVTAQLDGESHEVRAGEALFIPINMRHRLVNNGDEEVGFVFHLSPLAPEPPLGHVDTE